MQSNNLSLENFKNSDYKKENLESRKQKLSWGLNQSKNECQFWKSSQGFTSSVPSNWLFLKTPSINLKSEMD